MPIIDNKPPSLPDPTPPQFFKQKSQSGHFSMNARKTEQFAVAIKTTEEGFDVEELSSKTSVKNIKELMKKGSIFGQAKKLPNGKLDLKLPEEYTEKVEKSIAGGKKVRFISSSGEIEEIKHVRIKVLSKSELSELNKFINDIFNRTIVIPQKDQEKEKESTETRSYRDEFFRHRILFFKLDPLNVIIKKLLQPEKRLFKLFFREREKLLTERAEESQRNLEHKEQEIENSSQEAIIVTEVKEKAKKEHALEPFNPNTPTQKEFNRVAGVFNKTVRVRYER